MVTVGDRRARNYPDKYMVTIDPELRECGETYCTSTRVRHYTFIAPGDLVELSDAMWLFVETSPPRINGEESLETGARRLIEFGKRFDREKRFVLRLREFDWKYPSGMSGPERMAWRNVHRPEVRYTIWEYCFNFATEAWEQADTMEVRIAKELRCVYD